MSKFATPFRFLDDGTGTGGGSWYNPAPTWANQQDMVQQRVDRMIELLPGVTRNVNNPNQGGRVLVAGCGFGFLVYALFQAGYNAWGVDGEWARGEAQVRMPGLQDHVGNADCTSETSLAAFRTTIGIRNRKFDAVITEDLLSTADSAAEIQTMLTALRNDSAPNNRAHVLHFITMYDETQPWSGILIGTPGEQDWYVANEASWLALIGDNAERIVNIAGNRLVR